MDIWLWICDLPISPEDWSTNTFVYPLASSNHGSSATSSAAQTIQLRAERASSRLATAVGSTQSEDCLTFSITIQGFDCCNAVAQTKLWESDMCPLSSKKQLFLPLILQLIQEIIDRCPTSSFLEPNNTSPQSSPLKLKPDAVEWILGTHSSESFSGFFSLIFLTRLFWLCAFDAPSAVGSLYFQSFLARNLEILSGEKHMPVLRAFLLAAGVDIERCVARAVGYMLVKCLIMRDMRVGLASQSPLPSTSNLGLAYASEAHGLWMLRSHTPVWAMKTTLSSLGKNPFLVKAKESALRYSLAHQQLEAVIQLEYSVRFREDHIQVSARVNNIRLHMAKLGFHKEDESAADTAFGEEIYFPSRIRAWIGPEIGTNYVASVTLGRSTGNVEREVEMQRVVKGNLGYKLKAPNIKATSTSTRMKVKNWKWDQDAEGNTVIYDAVLYDSTNGAEVYKMDPLLDGYKSVAGNNGFRKRYTGSNRLFTKSGGSVFSGDECGERVTWRLNKEMEGSVLKWRIGSRVWLSYWPSDASSSCYETRLMEVCDEVDLPLMPTK